MTSKANILIVDDEVETVDMISFLLESQGYAVISAYSGAEALEILGQGSQKPARDLSPIDLVILDVRIPDVDGYEVCRVIKQDDHLKYIPVIMVTGLGSVEDAARGLAIGANDYVSKPFRTEELLARVKAMLRVRAIEQELLQHTHELATLNEINKAITSSLDLDQILSRTMHSIQGILRVEASSLLLLDENSGLLEFKEILSGSNQEQIAEFKLKPGEGIAGHVVRDGEPLLVLDAQNDPRFCPRIDEAIGFVTRSVLCVPLEVKGKTIGAIEVINKLDGQFNENDLWLLNYMAGSVAIALENARLYTELSDFARELEKSQAQLIQAEKLAAMGRLAASIAHEINNPLQAIHNCLHLTLKKPLNEEKKTRYLGMAQEEVDRLITIVQRMLEFYRPSREGMAPTDVHTIIENVLALSSKRLQHGKITVTKKLAPDLPPINAVSDQLKQVFLNIVINAIEAMPQGGELRMETKLSEDGQELSVAFTDTGVGLSEKEQENIFEPFFTTKTMGTGLGLSVSYGIIERHGGRIEVQSELGKGATFTVYLPLNSPT